VLTNISELMYLEFHSIFIHPQNNSPITLNISEWHSTFKTTLKLTFMILQLLRNILFLPTLNNVLMKSSTNNMLWEPLKDIFIKLTPTTNLQLTSTILPKLKNSWKMFAESANYLKCSKKIANQASLYSMLTP